MFIVTLIFTDLPQLLVGGIPQGSALGPLRVYSDPSPVVTVTLTAFFSCCAQVRFSWLFFVGAVPVFLSFFIATLLCHYNNWDPVLVGLRRVYAFICRKHRIQR